MTRPIVAAILSVTLAGAVIGACTDDRDPFHGDRGFDLDASSDAGDCRLQCSLDGRSVIEACTGKIIETCADDLACGAAACQAPCAAAAADRSSNGCDFYFQMPRMDKVLPHSCNAAFIVNPSTQSAELKLERDGKALDISRSLFRTLPGSADLIAHSGPVAPGDSVILFLSDSVPPPPDVPDFGVRCPAGVTPATLDDPVPHRTGIGSSFRLTTNVPVALTSMYPFGGAASYVPTATLVLPVPTWSTEHVVVNGWSAGSGGAPSMQIVASEDGTEITIIPNHDIQDGKDVVGALAHAPAKYNLSRGQHLQIVQEEELTGSFVTSNKVTTIFGGNSCGQVPSAAAACDILSQQIPPFAQWGSEYVGVAYRPRAGNEHEAVPYRIVAAREGTRLEYDPESPAGAPTTLNAGEVASFRRGTGDAFVVRTQDIEHPIYVSAHMTGGAGDHRTAQDYAGSGDPEFVNIVATAQYSNTYSFYADPTYAETAITIVRKKSRGAFSDVWLECAGNLTGWRAVGNGGEYEYTRVDLARSRKPGDTFGEGDAATVCRTGLQRMRSEGPFTATLWGWDRYASYAYPGGTALRPLVTTPLVPVH